MLVAGVLSIGACQPTASSFRTRAQRASAAGRHGEAIPLYIEYLDRLPARAEAHYELGEAYLETDRPLQAAGSFRIAYELEPDRREYLDALLDALIAADQPEEAYAVMRDRADAVVTETAYIELGDLASRVGLPDEAETAYRAAAALDPDSRSAAPYEALARLYARLEKPAEEIAVLRVLLYIEPNDAEHARRIRELGEIPGPTFARPPESLDRP